MSEIRDALLRALATMQAGIDAARGMIVRDDGEALADALPEVDRALRAVYEAADGAKRTLTLYRAPVHARYDPIAAARAQSAHLVEPSLASMMAKEFVGDAEQVTECLRLVVENGKLAQGGVLSLAVYPEGQPPRIEARLNHAAALPTVFRIANVFEVSIGELSERWNGATAGGRVDVTCSGLVLNLRGERRAPESLPWARAALPPVQRLVRRLTPWRGAIGHFEYGASVDEATRGLYGGVLDKVVDDIGEARSRIASGG